MGDIVVADYFGFDGVPLPVFMLDEKPHWIAKQVGAALGYERDGLVTMVTRDWDADFEDGRDYRILRGKQLKDFKRLIEVDEESSLSSYAPKVMLLTEPGVHAAATLSRKEAGRRLRRWLFDEVMPQLVRDGSYIPGRQIVGGEVMGGISVEHKRADAEIIRAEADKLRAGASGRRADAMLINAETRRQTVETRRRWQEASAYRKMADAQLKVGEITDVEHAKMMRHSCEIIVGGRIEKLESKDEGGPWRRARDLSRLWKVSEQMVGRTAAALGLRGNIDGLVREAVGRRQHSGGSTIVHEYSVRGQQMIKAEIDRKKGNQQELPIA